MIWCSPDWVCTVVSIHQSTSVINPGQPGMERQLTDNYEENMYVWCIIYILVDFGR